MRPLESRKEWFRPPYVNKEVTQVIHATHLENVPSIVVECDDGFADSDFATLRLTAREAEDNVLGLPIDSKLLYFACPLGPAWEQKCRYGSIAFTLSFASVVASFRRAVKGIVVFRQLGTDKYTSEYSHKVLVCRSDDPHVNSYPLIEDNNDARTLSDLPFYCMDHQAKWFVPDRGHLEQMEFVFKFPSGLDSIEVNASVKHVDHQTICVPNMKKSKPQWCPNAVKVPGRFWEGDRWDYRTNVRYTTEMSEVELAAYFLLEHPQHCLVKSAFFQNAVSRLCANIRRVFKLQDLLKHVQADMNRIESELGELQASPPHFFFPRVLQIVNQKPRKASDVIDEYWLRDAFLNAFHHTE